MVTLPHKKNGWADIGSAEPLSSPPFFGEAQDESGFVSSFPLVRAA